MANIRYFIKDTKESTIYVRFNHGRKINVKRSTHFKIDADFWNADKEEIRKKTGAPQDRDFINHQLGDLKTRITSSFNTDNANGTIIDGAWLESTIKLFFKQEEQTDLNLLYDYFNYFIKDVLPYKENPAKQGEIGVSARTIEKYENSQSKIKGFETHKKKRLYLADINPKFKIEFIKYLKNIEKLNDNTIGRYITFVKTVCRDARDNGIKTHPLLDKVTGFKKETAFIILTPPEIKKIEEHDFQDVPHLENARDWLIVGLNTGQRVSDFLNFTKETIKKNRFLEFKQMKTDAKTIVPLHESVKKVIRKNNGQFPRKISAQKFNTYIKEVCKRVGLDEPTAGKKMNPKTNRKEEGIFPKHELVSSHICRRSFSSNHYGKLPTPVLMNITNHSTEKMFLTYIGKTPEDSAKQLEEYWNQLKK
jgi:hypothetical protein